MPIQMRSGVTGATPQFRPLVYANSKCIHNNSGYASTNMQRRLSFENGATTIRIAVTFPNGF